MVALWPATFLTVLADALAAGTRGVERAVSAHGLAVAEFAAEPIDPFINVNTPADLAAVAAWLG